MFTANENFQNFKVALKLSKLKVALYPVYRFYVNFHVMVVQYTFNKDLKHSVQSVYSQRKFSNLRWPCTLCTDFTKLCQKFGLIITIKI